MVWDPTIPAASADLLSAPVRGNFAALDTTVMAALTAMANGAVLYRTTGPVIAGLPAVVSGAVLASAGVATTPTWSTTPTLTGLALSGLTAGSLLFAGASGVVQQDNPNLFWDDTLNNLRLFGAGWGTGATKVLALGGPSGVPTTSAADTVQVYVSDIIGEAGSASLYVLTERGGLLEFATHSTVHGIWATAPGGTRGPLLGQSSTNTIGLHGNPNAVSEVLVPASARSLNSLEVQGDSATNVALYVNGLTTNLGKFLVYVSGSHGVNFQVQDTASSPVLIRVGTLLRTIEAGNANSAGAGYRYLAIAN